MSQVISGSVGTDLIDTYQNKCFLKEEFEIGFQFMSSKLYQQSLNWNEQTWSFLLQQLVFRYCQNSNVHANCQSLDLYLGSIWVETAQIYNSTSYLLQIAVPQVPSQTNVIQDLLKNSLQDQLASNDEVSLCTIEHNIEPPYHQNKLFITGLILGVIVPVIILFILAITWACNVKEVKLSRLL
jgi:hypothetical protein